MLTAAKIEHQQAQFWGQEGLAPSHALREPCEMFRSPPSQRVIGQLCG